jgi:hypothetical protein
MGLELNRELAEAKRVLDAAAKAKKKLTAAGVSDAEIGKARALYAKVLGERKTHLASAGRAHDQTHDKHALMAEGLALIEQARRSVRLALHADSLAGATELHDLAAVGGAVTSSAARLEAVAEAIAKAASDARWQKALKRRGLSSAVVKRLAEVAHALDGAAPYSVEADPALGADLRALLRQVSYLRQAALVVFGAHSAEYAPFRARPPRKHAAAAPAPEPSPAPGAAS